MSIHTLAYKKKSKKGEDEDDKWGVVIQVILGLVVLLFILAYIVPKSTTEYDKYGVKVVSEIKLDDLRSAQYIALYNTTLSPEELTCKFELSAISKPDPRGYRIKIQTGDTGITLRTKDAIISGSSPEEMLRACHVFACLRDGVECPDFDALDRLLNESQSISVVIDNGTDQKGGMGYSEIMGALSYMQTKKADTNHDGEINQSEVDANEFFIYPFIKEGDTCMPQPVKTLIEVWNRTNETADCAKIAPAIFILPANETSIRVSPGRVTISGNGDAFHTAGIIVRDIIDPEWVRRFHGQK